ncbi:chloride channel protein [Litorilinea aerophila]|uniref:CBS domain-containing protein n=1 Tax=Litorilinea aerophila TaxID=1204385 RepID=A0A540VK41_9CHLR|nr:chloride channel protein [Litorilinea aerophila]MCC9075222.1 chloride channel protein [Litorilinea aerophila]GIV78366.1 MAG: chloride channel protein [Litorilinea sp.]
MKANGLWTALPIRWLDRWLPSEVPLLAGAAILVGLGAGGSVWLFKYLIEVATAFSFGWLAEQLLQPWGSWTVALVPVLGGLVVGLIVHFFVGVERHHGVAGIIESVALAGGRLRYWRIPAKALASVVSIGSGASVGPEDPSVQIGAGFGSMFGQLFRLSDERVRALVAGGAAAGIAAAFNAPIAGVFFSLELLLGELNGNAWGTIILASFVSAVFTQAVSGPQPAFHIPAYAFHSIGELPLYLGLGLVAGPIAALYVRLLYTFQDLFHLWHVPRWCKPMAAGLVVGLVGIWLPQLFGVGYGTIEAILAGQDLAIGLLLALLVGKLILTPVSIGGGFLGGVFAPSLFVGAVLGGAYGLVCEQLFPGLPLAPPAFAMVGMAAVLAGAVHAPLTAIILLFEMTNDYRIILPLMFAVTVSILVSQRLQRDSVYTLGLARHGIRIERGRDVEVLEAITVGEVMQRTPVLLFEDDTLEEATDKLMEIRAHGLPVLNRDGELTGILTVQDIERAQTAGKTRVSEACTRELVVAYPDESLAVALRRMGVRDIGRLPVVDRDNPRRLLGVLRRTDVIRAYDLALTRREALRHRAHQVRLGAVSGLNVEEIRIGQGAPCAGRRVSEVPWPRDSVIATLRRKRKTLIPHGDTVLQPGDILAVVAEGEALQEVRSLCGDGGAAHRNGRK